MVVALVCVEGIGEVMVMVGAPLATTTWTVAMPDWPAALRACAVMMLRPVANETLGTEKTPFACVKGTPFTSPETTSAPTVPVTATVVLLRIWSLAGAVMAIDGEWL